MAGLIFTGCRTVKERQTREQNKYDICECGHTRQNHAFNPYQNIETICKVPECKTCLSFKKKGE